MSLLTLLTGAHLRHDEADPHWPDRDRLIVSGQAHAGVPEGATTIDGPPGLSVGAATGVAMAERMLAARFGRSLVDHRTWLLAQPRDLAAGPAQEALGIASALMLGRLAVLVSMPQREARLMARYTAAGWTVRTVETGDTRSAEAALCAASRSQKPTLIVDIGKAEPAGPAQAPPSYPHPAMEAGGPGPSARRAWLKRLRRHAQGEAFQHALGAHYRPGWHRAAYADDTPPDRSPHPEAATMRALARLAATLPELASLPHKDLPALAGPPSLVLAATPPAWDGLDQAAAACSAGMALHGGLLPVLRCTPQQAETAAAAMRLAADHGARLLQIVVRTDDAGETPAAPPGVGILTPCDPAESLDCLILALRQPASPSMLVLPPSAPPVPPAAHRQCARGGYLVHEPAARDVTLLVAGAGMTMATAVRDALTAHGVEAALVSIPSRSLFAAQDATYQGMVLGAVPRVYFGGAARFAGLAGPEDMLVELDHLADAARLAGRISARLNAERENAVMAV